ncbi:hypothetical protein FACS1894171_0160 [Clostridia bacterium]|nr:hypothetical protein FACS1894171_0160 [Clostridia bacterium]
MSENIIIFGGTSEGRRLAQHLSRFGVKATICVASEYGSGVLPKMPGITVNEGRLDSSDIADMLDAEALVIDATHPYAAEVTANIRAACEEKESLYYRLFRPEASSGDIRSFNSCEDVVKYLSATNGNVLLTTGSRTLEEFTKIRDYEDRVYPRILPDPDSLKAALELGFKPGNLICMQGPFSEQMNVATIQAKQIRYLVTKDSGAPGGTMEKINAALSAGIEAVIIGRPPDGKGLKYAEMVDMLNRRLNIVSYVEKHLRFPLFVDIFEKKIVVFGGGTVAARRVTTLLKFGAKITVVSPKVTPPLAKFIKNGQIVHRPRKFSLADLDGAALAVAATNDRETNHDIAVAAAAKNIPISVADCPEECTFFFPAIALGENIVAGIVSDGDDHKLTVQAASRVRELLGTM